MGRLGNVRHRLGFDHNDLRRPVDRRQRAVGVGAVVLFAGLAPPVAAVLAAQTYGQGVRAEQQSAAYQRIDARITHVKERDGVGLRHAYAELSWTARDGRSRTAVLPADSSVRPGMSRRIWVDSSGALVSCPRTRAATITATAVTAIMTGIAAGLPLLAFYRFARRRYDRHREALWDESLITLTHGKIF